MSIKADNFIYGGGLLSNSNYVNEFSNIIGGSDENKDDVENIKTLIIKNNEDCSGSLPYIITFVIILVILIIILIYFCFYNNTSTSQTKSNINKPNNMSKVTILDS